ncbi:TM0106 family RecB-like putative nuclease [Kineococcus sp. SYSU DK002]|uniref:TM0106 family RecB-like putative nuclease n=1 Tax=Kineococcus sp. SYSU DK002 TaxID=3383123 RepID=UPI003D7DA5EB
MTPRTRPVLLSAYAARTCARAVHNDFDVTVPRPPHVVPNPHQHLLDEGVRFEEDVFARWLALDVDVLDLRGLRGEAQVTATLAALERGCPVVLGGRLPDDPAGARTGLPDVLVREADGSGYHPVDVKAHKTLSGEGAGARVSTLLEPHLAYATDAAARAKANEGDLLQLAHYWRMLQACGHQADTPWGAVVGTDAGGSQLTWFDLSQPRFTAFSRSRGKVRRSALQRYDHEHGFRVSVARTAQGRRGAPADPAPLVVPVGQAECATCRWAPVCVDTLPADDLSRRLPARLSVREHLALRRAGISTVQDLADADVAALLDSPYTAETSDVVQRERRLRTAQVEARLTRDGADLRLREGAVVDVPTSPVEVDLDMESSREGRVYLWGVLVTVDGTSTYTPFLDLHVDDPDSELALAVRCFDWLAQRYPDAVVYHYSPVEKTVTRRILGGRLSAYAGTAADPATWVDLLPTTRASFDSRGGHGLKFVATKGAGFRWRDTDPGGAQSQLWLGQARTGDRAAEQRVLEYNEDDVLATLAVRRWLRSSSTAHRGELS